MYECYMKWYMLGVRCEPACVCVCMCVRASVCVCVCVCTNVSVDACLTLYMKAHTCRSIYDVHMSKRMHVHIQCIYTSVRDVVRCG